MATIIRHGPAGSYKSSYSVWYEVLPALRQGRIVITNVEGMRTLEEIEKLMGERFPNSARLYRISSQNKKGKALWQNWYNWCHLGALILIDEAQDIFNKTTGFDMAKNTFLGIDAFSEYLPADYIDFYNRIKKSFKPPEDYVDDIGERIVDENGLIIMPENFEEAFQRHRKYNWDIVLCTPNISKLGSEIKSVSETAINHSSLDGILPWKKRQTRMFFHDPRSTSIHPTKDDRVDKEKVPRAVHLLYLSTATGKTTRQNRGRPLYKEPKLMSAALALIIGFSVMINGLMGLNSDNSSTQSSVSSQQTAQPNSSSSSDGGQVSQTSLSQTSGQASPVPKERVFDSLKVSADSVLHSVGVSFKSNDLLVMPLPVQAKEVFVSSVVTQHIGNAGFKKHFVNLEIVGLDNKSHYFDSELLYKMGFNFQVVDPCLVVISYSDAKDYVTCRSHIEREPVRDEEDVQVARKTPQDLEQDIKIF